MTDGHRLILLRHAKAAWPDGVDDPERPLADQGRADAAAAAALIAGLAPDAVLCSPALRTRQTWRLAGAALAPEPLVQLTPELYEEGPDGLVGVVRGLPETNGTALVVGHEPTMSTTVLKLAGDGSDAAALARVRQKYPTCGLAVLEFTGPWTGLKAGGAVLERFEVPRG